MFVFYMPNIRGKYLTHTGIMIDTFLWNSAAKFSFYFYI